MRLFPFPSEDIQVGIDISIDAIRLIATNTSTALGVTPSTSTGLAEVLSIWEFQCDLLEAFDSTNPASWIDVICETLANELPEHTGIRAAATSISIPTSWLHWATNNNPNEAIRCASRLFAGAPFFSVAHTASWPVVPSNSGAVGSPDSQDPHVFASVSENAILRIATTLQTRGYRVERVIPDGIAVGCRSIAAIDQTSPCIAMMHRDGGSVTIFDDGIPALVRTLPPIGHSSDPGHALPSKSPSAADVRNWSEIVGREIQATFDYYARCSGEWKFSDRVTAENPIVFAGSLFPLLKRAGYDAADLLGQWSNDLERPVSLWSSNCLIEPLFQSNTDNSTEPDQSNPGQSNPGQSNPGQSNPEHATALSLAMLSQGSASKLNPTTSSITQKSILAGINLLPPAFNLRNRHKDVRFRWAGALTIATVVTLMFAINGYLLQREAIRLVDDRVEIIEPIRSHLKQLESVIGLRRSKLELLQKVAKQQPPDDGLQALAAITHAIVPLAIELQSVDIDFVEGVWDITGRSESEEALVEMAGRLKSTGWVATFTPPQGADAVIVSASDARSNLNTDQSGERNWVRHEDGSFRWNPQLGGFVTKGSKSQNGVKTKIGAKPTNRRTATALDRREVQR